MKIIFATRSGCERWVIWPIYEKADCGQTIKHILTKSTTGRHLLLLKDDVQQYGVIFFSSLRSELEILKWPISFGLGGRLNSDMVDDFCRNGWTILSEYALVKIDLCSQ
jgi:hypothetical protein